MLRFWVLWSPHKPLGGLSSLGKMLFLPVQLGQAPRGQEVTLVFLGREGQIVLWLESQNSRKPVLTPWNTEGGGGFSLPTSGTLYGEKRKPDLKQSQGEEGELQQVRAGPQAAGSVPQWWAGRR